MLVQQGWEQLASILRALAHRAGALKYVPNHGNAGDALIAAGAWQLFDRLELAPRVSRRQFVRRGDTVLYAGGGNLVPEYQSCARFLERCLRVGVRAAVVLPQTIRGHEALLRELDGRFTLACRDETSLERVRATGTRAVVVSAPDLALGIDVDALFARCARLDVRAAFARDLALQRNLVAYGRWRRQLHALAAEMPRTAHIIRTDVESVPGVQGKAAWDVSNLYVSNFRPRSESDFVSRDYLRFVARAEKVVTNRLHAGVAAALMGRSVTLLDNSYGKIRAVYETSLRNVPGVEFRTGDGTQPATSRTLQERGGLDG